MKNFRIEVDGCVIKEYQYSQPAYKAFLINSRKKNSRVNLYELKSHAFGFNNSLEDHYVLIDSNVINK